MMRNRIKYLYFSLMLLPFSGQSQDVYLDFAAPTVKTNRITVKGNELSYPAIELGSEQMLYFEFDELQPDSKSYSYEIIHCNAKWQKSPLSLEEYQEGFFINEILNYDYARNTKVSYVHYGVDLPNEDVQLMVSGNYVIRVFLPENPDSTVVQNRFCVFEPLLNIQTEISRPLGGGQQDLAQEIRFVVSCDDFTVDDPFTELEVVISQNNRPRVLLQGLKPLYVRNNELIYGAAGEHVLPGGSEFRMFSIPNFNEPGIGVNAFKYVDSMYHVQLRYDERRSAKRYFFSKDMNGRYAVYVDNSYDYDLTADYAQLYFSLRMPEPFLDGTVYVLGSFNNWEINEASKMNYNYTHGAYENSSLLKQGYYDYCYVFVDTYTGEMDVQKIEGSHFETENDYLIKIFYKGFTDRYQRLIAYRVNNSLYQN